MEARLDRISAITPAHPHKPAGEDVDSLLSRLSPEDEDAADAETPVPVYDGPHDPEDLQRTRGEEEPADAETPLPLSDDTPVPEDVDLLLSSAELDDETDDSDFEMPAVASRTGRRF